MSSALDHHARAEQLLDQAHAEQDSIRRGLILAEAQVHATLALSAPADKGPPGPGQAQTGSAASTGETRPAFPMRPGVPPGATTHPTWRDDLARTGPPEVTGRRRPTANPPCAFRRSLAGMLCAHRLRKTPIPEDAGRRISGRNRNPARRSNRSLTPGSRNPVRRGSHPQRAAPATRNPAALDPSRRPQVT